MIFIRELTREEQVLLHLLRRNLHPDADLLPDSIAEQTDWLRVMSEAGVQTVLLPAFDAAAPYKRFMPEMVRQMCMQRCAGILSHNLRVSKVREEMVQRLESCGFPYVILKGDAAAAYYPRPQLRQLGDVDFLIDPVQKREVEECLSALGYTGQMHEHICHVVLKKPGAHLEMHFETVGIPYHQQGEWVREAMADALSCAQPFASEKSVFAAPGGFHHGLILLLHMQHHMVAEGLGLRHLCDWAAYVEHTWREPFWQERLLPTLKKVGLMRYAAVMTCVCGTAFGTVCPDWAAGVDDALCREVLLDILTGGNFGRKNRNRSKAGMMISQHGKEGVSGGSVYNLWKTLHHTTPGRFPIVNRIRILHPVLDGMRVLEYLGKVAVGKRPSLIRIAPLAKARRGVYEQLKIFETEEAGE